VFATARRRLLGQLLERSSHVETDCDRESSRDAEFAAGRRTPEVYRTLTQQAAMTIRELSDLADANGLHAAITIAGGKANSAAVAAGWSRPAAAWSGTTNQCGDVGGLGCVKPTRSAGRTCHRGRPRDGMAGERYPFRSL
jgi:hypothetical protein